VQSDFDCRKTIIALLQTSRYPLFSFVAVILFHGVLTIKSKAKGGLSVISEIVGTTVKNDGTTLEALLEKHLQASNFCHTGNYVFSADLPDGKVAVVTTAPADAFGDEIRILGLHIYET
jgi:hypothetical protein